MASTIVEIDIERAVSTENMVMPCSRNKVRIISAKDVFLSRTFSRICLILTTCVWRSFRFCDSISRLGCFSVFRWPDLSLYNCFYSSKQVGSFSTSSNFLVSPLMCLLISPSMLCKALSIPKILKCQGQYFVMLPVSYHEYLQLKTKAPPGVYFRSLYPLVIHA